MGIKIQRRTNDERQEGSSLFTVLACMFFPSRWKGRRALELSRLGLEDKLPALLYFRSKGCVACGLIDMRVVQASLKAGVSLAIIDRHPGIASRLEDGGRREDGQRDSKVCTVADYDGMINRAYGVAVYPCFVFIGRDGRIALKEVGANGKVEAFSTCWSVSRRSRYSGPAWTGVQKPDGRRNRASAARASTSRFQKAPRRL